MFLAMVAFVLTLTGLERAIQKSQEEIVEVEMGTGHADWGKTKWNSAKGSYASLSALMSGSASNLAACDCDRNFLDHCLEEISAYNIPEIALGQDGYLAGRSKLDECIDLLAQRSKQAEAHIRNYSRRAEIQLTAVSIPFIFADARAQSAPVSSYPLVPRVRITN